MATVLGIYREALRLIGEHDIASSSEDVESRYVMDAAYEGAVQYCMSLGWWRFTMQTESVSASTSTVPGYSRQFAKPAQWLRTHSVSVTTGTLSVPVDWTESGTNILCKFATVTHRYLVGNKGEDEWPEVFAKVVAAYLASEICERITQSRANKSDVFQIFEQRLAEARQSESVTPPYILPEHSVERAARHLLEQGFWRFSVKTVSPSSTTGPASGFTNVYTLPADHLRTYDASIAVGGNLRMVDRHEEAGKLSTQNASTILRYVSADFIDPAKWPESFRQAVDAYLMVEMARASGISADVEQAKVQYDRVLNEALGKDALPRPYALDPQSIQRAARYLLEEGFWRFSLKTTALTHNAGLPATDGFAYRAAKPADWMRSYSVSVKRNNEFFPVDFRDVGGNLHTDYDAFTVQYVSSDFASVATWPEAFYDAVRAYLAFEDTRNRGAPAAEVEQAKKALDRAIDAGLAKEALPRPMMLNEGSYRRAAEMQLEQGLWKFALKTAVLSPEPAALLDAYEYSFEKPADWVRTATVTGAREAYVDFRDEDGMLHADHEAITLRYVSSDAIDPENWTQLFTKAWYALLRHEEARQNQLPEGEVQGRYTTWRRHLGEAVLKDGLNERPKVHKTSIFAAARRGVFSSREQG